MGIKFDQFWPKAMLAMLFAIAQLAAAVHAAEFGNGPHTHDDTGIMCDVFLLEDHDAVLCPPEAPVVSDATPQYVPRLFLDDRTDRYDAGSRWPPSTGPPAVI